MISRLVDAFRGSPAPAPPTAAPAAEIPELWWLTDVPSFIDEQSIDRLYNAVVKPEYLLLQASETVGEKHGAGETAEGGGGGEVSIPAFWKLSASAKIGANRSEEHAVSTQVTKQFVYSAEGRLQEIVTACRDRYRGRLLFENPDGTSLRSLDGAPCSWKQAEALLDTPGSRPLIFLDFAPGECILPVVGETVDGHTILLLDNIVAGLREKGCDIPDFPYDPTPAGSALRLVYWKLLMEHYDNRAALTAIQKGFGDGERIEWIDLRIKTRTRERPLLCHFSSGGKFPNGMFALSLVRRGHKEGFRLVAQLKKGCDLNILAFYER
jgi:hypothetical protein